MSLDTFLHAVLPSSGTFFIATESQQQGHRFKNWGVGSIPSLVREIRKQAILNKNVWFGVSSFKDKSKRTADNAVSRKSIVLDLDCGADYSFPTKRDAAQAFSTFRQMAGLPSATHLVDSGHGLHPYWAFTEDIDAERWLHTAQLLKELCALLDFEADPTVTADLARIIRAPETTNYKPDMPDVGAGIMHESADLLDFLDFHNRVMNALEKHKPVADNSDLTAGVDVEDFPEQEYSAKLMLGDCEILRGMHETGGEHVSELHWMQALLLLAYCKDGEEYIHAIGDKHPTYTKKKTVRKFNIQQAKKQRGKGKPILCKTLAPCAPALCAKCRHNGKIKTPLMCGRERNSVLPEPYFDGVNGTFRTVVGGEHDGEVRFVCPYKFTAMDLARDGEALHMLAAFKLLPSGRDKAMAIPTALLADKPGFAAAAATSMTLQDNERKELNILMTSWAQKLEDAGNITTLVTKFGWVTDHNKQGFSTGNTVYWADGATSKVRLQDRTLCDIYTPSGTDTAWRELASIINSQSNPAADMVLAASFAAPLMSLTGDSGAVLSITSAASGTGKTTLLRLAQAVWGDPRVGLSALDDTPASIMNKIGVLNNLPVLWDEVRTPKDVANFIKMIFRVGQGKDKARLARNSASMHTNAWDTLMISASNIPIRDHMEAHEESSDAGVKRIFEIEQPEVPGKDDRVAALVIKLSSNYGHAGVVYAQWLAAHRTDAEAMVAQVRERLGKELKPDTAERFWMSMAISCVTAAGITNRLGLTNIKMGRLMGFITDTIEAMRAADMGDDGQRNVGESAAGLVIRFMEKYYRNTVITENFWGRDTAVGLAFQLPDDAGAATYVHIAKNERKIRLDAVVFDRWAYDTYGSKSPQKNMLKAGGATEHKYDLGRGVMNTSHRRRTYEIPLDTPTFADVAVT